MKERLKLLGLAMLMAGLIGGMLSLPTWAAKAQWRCVYYQQQTTKNRTATVCAYINKSGKIAKYKFLGSNQAKSYMIKGDYRFVSGYNPKSLPRVVIAQTGVTWSKMLTKIEDNKPASFQRHYANKAQDDLNKNNKTTETGGTSGSSSSNSSGTSSSSGAAARNNQKLDNGVDDKCVETSILQTKDGYFCEEDNGGGGIFYILNLILTIVTWGVGIAATVGLVWTSIKYIMSSGDPGKTAQAKMRILEIVIGLALYASLWAILNWLLPGGVLHP